MQRRSPQQPPRRSRPPLRVLLAASALALLLHATLLGGADLHVGLSDTPAATMQWMNVRRVAVPAPLETQPVAQATAPPVTPGVAPPKRSNPVTLASDGPARNPVHREQTLIDVVGGPIAPADAVGEAPAAEADTSSPLSPELVKTVASPPAASADITVPVYPTAMPPAMTLHYDMRRGLFSGTGELLWKPAGDHYETRLEGRVAGLHVLTETSTGLIDQHGLAPLRYTDLRLRRALVAANFQRDKGKITYSGPQVEYPLLPGAQDRVSWMIQIGAVLNAQPQLASAGGRITFFVTGARGDADVWAFRYVGSDEVRIDSGAVRAVKFTREPRRPYDRLVEIWLAPGLRHLPVRARLTADSDKDVFELLLRDMQAP